MRASSPIWILAATLVAGCTVGPRFTPPVPRVPAHWPAVDGADESPAALGAWWRGFHDAELDSLIARSVDANLDLRAAVLAIDAARAERAIAAAAGWPTLSADASYDRQRFSETTATGSLFNSIGSLRLPAGVKGLPNPYNQFQLAADASWELDLFGRVRRAVEAADANVQVSIEDRRAVLVAVLADVAQSYVELRGAQQRERIARENLATTEELLELARLRRAAGLTTDIDVSNAAAEVAATRAELPAFELQVTLDIHSLGRLLGREPESLRRELAPPASVPGEPPRLPIGLPADLARRRPDVRAAEAALHAATAQIGVAVANLFPRLVLGGAAGTQSASGNSLLDWASRFAAVGPRLDVPVFDRGRWQTVRLQDVRAKQAALAYQRTVLGALHDVENALAARRADRQRSGWLAAAAARNRTALALARQRYGSGVANFIDVLDALRSLQKNELALADSTTAVDVDLIRLYRALGGGWQS